MISFFVVSISARVSAEPALFERTKKGEKVLLPVHVAAYLLGRRAVKNGAHAKHSLAVMAIISRLGRLLRLIFHFPLRLQAAPRPGVFLGLFSVSGYS